MLDFSAFLNLPMIWGGLILTALILYVALDGFDLGVGILFPFAPSDDCRNKMINSIAPFWDGNETWLILGGGGLFAAFPLAYAIIMPAMYLPVLFMLLGLIFRGVAFEFRYKAHGVGRVLWDMAFHYGSLLAAFMQGVILGGIIQGITVVDRSFAGGPYDWLSAFSMMTGMALVCGYALLGSTWLVMKTCGETNEWARRTGLYFIGFVALFMGIVSIAMPMMNENVRLFWFSLPNFLLLAPIPIFTLLLFILLWKDLRGHQHEVRPFIYSQLIFLLGYVGLGVSIWPWVVPYAITLKDAAAFGPSQSLLLVGTVIFLPVVLGYTAYVYYLFRGKASTDATY